MAMASARMGSYEWAPSSDIVVWDEQHRAITGLAVDQSSGKDFLRLVHPDDAEANQLAIENTISGKCDYETEFRITRPDGEVRWLAARDAQNIAMFTPEPETSHANAHTQVSNVKLGCHILIVDDRRDIRFLTKRFLTGAGATGTEAEDGEVAVGAVTAAMEVQSPFDLVLLDMQMPKLDGYATAKILRKLGFQNPIVALTADAMQGDMNRCIESGCNDYLSKPIDRALLLNLVGKLTMRAEAHSEYLRSWSLVVESAF